MGLEALGEWFDDLREEDWDRQMEKDFSPAGRGAGLLERIDAQIAAGNAVPLEEGLRLRREQRTRG